MSDTRNGQAFRPKRKMDRLLIMLFFVDFTISIVLCMFVAKAVNQQKDMLEIGCENQVFLQGEPSQLCASILDETPALTP